MFVIQINVLYRLTKADEISCEPFVIIPGEENVMISLGIYVV